MQRRVLKHPDTQTHRQTDRQTDAHSHTTTPLGSLQQAGTWRAPADVILDRSGHSAGAADWTTGQLASTSSSGGGGGGGRHIRHQLLPLLLLLVLLRVCVWSVVTIIGQRKTRSVGQSATLRSTLLSSSLSALRCMRYVAYRLLCRHCSTQPIRDESVPIQLAQCRFHWLATSNAKMYGRNFIKQHSETFMV